jgi:CDP-glucose 4,6-dehydratase
VVIRQSTMENLALTSAGLASFWRGKRVVVTGHTGFKGAWLALWLHGLGAKVLGISLPPLTSPSLFIEADIGGLCDTRFSDIRDVSALADLIRSAEPDIVFHLAAQALVRKGYRSPLATFETNLMGTVHVLEALRESRSVRAAVIVTTDKVYRDTKSVVAHREDDPLGGLDPYSASKAASELAIECYRESYLSGQGIAVASARAGNVIGGGDWSEDRLIPDAVRAWQDGRALVVRRPDAVRPWQHVLEPLFGYLILARHLWHRPTLAGAYNFGPDGGEAVTVRDLIELARTVYGEGEVDYRDGSEGPHESAWLALNATKAAEMLGVMPKLTLVETVKRTMAWYRAHGSGTHARALCEAEISEFEAKAVVPSSNSAKLAG